MRILSWIFYIALFVLALGFALSNTEPVEVRFFADQANWRAPLVVVLLSAVAGGVLLGLIACIPSFFRLRREIAGLRKELKAQGRAAAANAGPVATDPPGREGAIASGGTSGGSSPPLGV
jgi:uncharacterized integral membrane protein